MRPRKKRWMDWLPDWLPKWTSVVVWVVILMLVCLNKLNAQSTAQMYQVGTYGSVGTYGEFLSERLIERPVEIVGYRIVMSDDMGCWSELEIINNDRYTGVKREIIIDKITKLELYGIEGESPLLEIRNKDNSISRYHLVKLPSDIRW